MATRTSNPVSRRKIKTGVIGAVTTLTAATSGTSYDLTTAGTDGAAVTLPALEAGLNFRFVVGSAFATTNWTVVSTTNVINGNVLVAGAHVAGASENTISFVASAESVGDWVDLYCNGTLWFAKGSGVTTGSITFTAA
tara:strand:+ start:45 stop:458 length:414 start_codon:yes stop_codon:yes gene_type:complete